MELGMWVWNNKQKRERPEKMNTKRKYMNQFLSEIFSSHFYFSWIVIEYRSQKKAIWLDGWEINALGVSEGAAAFILASLGFSENILWHRRGKGKKLHWMWFLLFYPPLLFTLFEIGDCILIPNKDVIKKETANEKAHFDSRLQIITESWWAQPGLTRQFQAKSPCPSSTAWFPASFSFYSTTTTFRELM